MFWTPKGRRKKLRIPKIPMPRFVCAATWWFGRPPRPRLFLLAIGFIVICVCGPSLALSPFFSAPKSGDFRRMLVAQLGRVGEGGSWFGPFPFLQMSPDGFRVRECEGEGNGHDW